ncbi:MAG: S10 family peptidase [Rhodanobacteraceae bacterium]
MRPSVFAAIFAAALLSGSAAAPAASPAKADKPAAATSGFELPPLPAAVDRDQSAVVDGHALKYTVDVGWLPVRDDRGKAIAQVVYTAYTIPGKHRPATFAFNGGPGASSVFLNFGAIGPKIVSFRVNGDTPSEPATLHDNPSTWLGFTDLVFIDPVGTGYSRSLVGDKQSTKDFYSTDADIHYLSQIVYDWLVKNGRMESPKYITGESYGGFRGPRITHYLQTRLGVAMNGMVLVSPYLDPMAWMTTLPSIAAAHLEREGKLTAANMAPIIAYTRGEYAETLMKGRSDPAAYTAMIRKVTELTGLDPTFVEQSGGRLETQAYLREVYRSEGKLGSRFDSNFTAWDPFPYAPRQRSGDPILNGITAPTTTAMVHFVTQTVGWKFDGQYQTLNYKVGRLWHDDDDAGQGSVKQLRESVANDPNLRVLIAHGWDDLSCPFMVSVPAVDQMPAMGDPTRVEVKEYPGGHMFYARPASDAMFVKDVHALFDARTGTRS